VENCHHRTLIPKLISWILQNSFEKKIKLAFCEEGNIKENGILSFVEAVLIPISQLRIDRINGDQLLVEGPGDHKPFITDGAPQGTVFTIERDAKFGGPTHYASYDDMEKDFAAKILHPKDLKAAVANGIINLLEPIRKSFEENEEWQAVEKLAYPDLNAKPEKKKKKEKVYHPPPPGKGKNVEVTVDEATIAPLTGQETPPKQQSESTS